MQEVNVVKEIAPGIYGAMLWCPEANLLADLLDEDFSFVLCWDHLVGNYEWEEFSLPLVDPTQAHRVISRLATFDFVLPTADFLGVLPNMKPAIKAVQLARTPPDYLDMRRVRAKELYRVLNECGWHVLLDTPANDYGQVLSPVRSVVERAVASMRG